MAVSSMKSSLSRMDSFVASIKGVRLLSESFCYEYSSCIGGERSSEGSRRYELKLFRAIEMPLSLGVVGMARGVADPSDGKITLLG